MCGEIVRKGSVHRGSPVHWVSHKSNTWRGEAVVNMTRYSMSIRVGIAICLACVGGVAAAEQMFVSDKLILNVYAAPDSSSEKVASLESGDQVETVEESEDFVLVRLADGTEGWVGASYLSSDAPAVIRLRRLEGEQKTALQQAEKKHSAELKKLQEENTSLRTEIDALKTKLEAPAPVAAAPPPPPEPAPEPEEIASSDSPFKSAFLWAPFVLLAGGAGFFAGYQTLARRVTKKFGGVKVY